MPRKSAAALSVLPPPRTRRPEPPDELSEEEAVEWKAVVHRLPPEWFPKETHQVLVAYCRHVVRGRMVARWIKSFRDEYLRMEGGVDRIDKLFAMGEREFEDDNDAGHADADHATEQVATFDGA